MLKNVIANQEKERRPDQQEDARKYVNATGHGGLYNISEDIVHLESRKCMLEYSILGNYSLQATVAVEKHEVSAVASDCLQRPECPVATIHSSERLLITHKRSPELGRAKTELSGA